MALNNWPQKFPGETLRNGADWTNALEGSQIVSCAAQVIEGDVVLTAPVATSFSGALQTVWVSGGTAGRQRVRLTVTLNDGRVLQEDFGFVVAA